MPGRLSCSPPTPDISPRRPEPSRRTSVALARATSSPGPSPRSPTSELVSALPSSSGISMSPSASSAQSVNSPCGRCATRSLPGRTPPATRRARSTTRWPPCSPGSVPTAPGFEGSSIWPFNWRRKPADWSAQLSVFPSGLAERTLGNVLYIVGDPMRPRRGTPPDRAGRGVRQPVTACPRLLHGGGGTQLGRWLRRGQHPD